ncbi:MAG: penicillin-binding protein 2 [Holosporales bacterium]|nr:penicillin-binding protein 2 [Holosporales bacterium]
MLHDNSTTSIVAGRLWFVSGGICFCFTLVAVRLVDLMVLSRVPVRAWRMSNSTCGGGIPRANIVDRNGVILATHLVTASAYADTREIQNVDEAVEQLSAVLTEYSKEELRRKVESGKSFIWLSRHLTPKKQYALQHAGIPGVHLKKDYKRVYPYGNLACHVIGYCDVDGEGIAGIENYFNSYLFTSSNPLKLSIDVRIQHIASELLAGAISEFRAIGGNVIVMDMHNGEIIAMESSPNVDLNQFNTAKADDLFNRNTLGVYEMGSVFKVLNTAIALESGKVARGSLFDARAPIKIGHFQVSDFRGKNQILTLDDAFVFSSNIAAVKIALQFGGGSVQKKFFTEFGVFEPISIELPEMGRPIYPARWSDVTMMSSTYGYGVAISPLRMISLVSGITTGYMMDPTLLCGHVNMRKRIVSNATATYLRHLMRRVVREGTAKQANVKGYRVFAKTGTAYKNKKGHYDSKGARRTVFVGGFPAEAPKYIVLLMLDEPKATERTYGFSTAGWNVVPYGGKLIGRIAPILGVEMADEQEEAGLGGGAAAAAALAAPAGAVSVAKGYTSTTEYLLANSGTHGA